MGWVAMVLESSITKPLGQKRMAGGLYEKGMVWVDKMKKFFANWKLSSHTVVNYDKCQIFLTFEGKHCKTTLINLQSRVKTLKKITIS